MMMKPIYFLLSYMQKKNTRNAPSMLSFCKLAGHINREKKILGISTGNFSQNRKYIAVSKATNSFSAVCN